MVTASGAVQVTLMVLATGCYAELRTRAELGRSAGTAARGAMLAGSVGVGNLDELVRHEALSPKPWA